jgi:hypothetical protein
MHSAKIAVLISSSPIESHPSTLIIEETIASIRYHLPESRIYIMQDGVRPEQAALTDRYVQYIMDLVGHCIMKDTNISMVPFLDFTHQAGMTMKTLERVEAPHILFAEHDTPLMERPIDWRMILSFLEAGLTNHVRLHYDEEIHPDHKHLMEGKVGRFLIQTRQFHNRPYIANTEWFRDLLMRTFNEKSRCFIEDRVYTFVENAPWDDYKLTIYDPEGTGMDMKRSRDLNGRGKEPKYAQVFG